MLERPIHGRCGLRTPCLVFVALVAGPMPAFAQPAEPFSALTEGQAVRRALERPALAEAIEGEVGVARARALQERLWPNPEVSYSREQSRGVGGTAEDYVWLSQRFDLSGRRGLKSRAAEHRAHAAGHGGQARRGRVAAEVRVRFYEVLLLQEHVAMFQDWCERLEVALAAVSRREAVGDASLYDRRRLEREWASVRAQLAARVAEREQAWSRLAALTGESEPRSWPRVSGTLLPDAVPARKTFVQRVETRPEVRALDEAASAAALERSAAGRWWVPQFDLGGGWKSIDPRTGTAPVRGFLAMATISLPIFDRHQDEALRARSERRRIRGARALAVSEARARTSGLWAEATQLREAARVFGVQRAEGAAALVRTTEAGYRGGELRVLELLDAYRSTHEDEQQAHELEFAARRARIELELISGGYAP